MDEVIRDRIQLGQQITGAAWAGTTPFAEFQRRAAVQQWQEEAACVPQEPPPEPLPLVCALTPAPGAEPDGGDGAEQPAEVPAPVSGDQWELNRAVRQAQIALHQAGRALEGATGTSRGRSTLGEGPLSPASQPQPSKRHRQLGSEGPASEVSWRAPSTVHLGRTATAGNLHEPGACGSDDMELWFGPEAGPAGPVGVHIYPRNREPRPPPPPSFGRRGLPSVIWIKGNGLYPSPRPRHISMENIHVDRRCEVYQGTWCSDPYALLPATTPTMSPAAANRLAVQSLGGRDAFQRYHASKREHFQRLETAMLRRYQPEEGQQPARPGSAGPSGEQVPPHLRPQQQQPAPAPRAPPPSQAPSHSRGHRRSR